MQWVKGPMLSLLWREFDLWPGNFHMTWGWPKPKQNRKKSPDDKYIHYFQPHPQNPAGRACLLFRIVPVADTLKANPESAESKVNTRVLSWGSRAAIRREAISDMSLLLTNLTAG